MCIAVCSIISAIENGPSYGTLLEEMMDESSTSMSSSIDKFLQEAFIPVTYCLLKFSNGGKFTVVVSFR